jgi:hypothetical protein
MVIAEQMLDAVFVALGRLSVSPGTSAQNA